MGYQHDEPADDETLRNDQRPDGSTYGQSPDIAPEDPGRVVLKQEICQQSTGQADKEQGIVDSAGHDRFEDKSAQNDQGEPGCQTIESRVHIDEICHDGYVRRDENLEVDQREIHFSKKGDKKQGCGDKGDQGVGTVIEQDQFCRPADIDHVIQHAEERKECYHNDDRVVNGCDDFPVK